MAATRRGDEREAVERPTLEQLQWLIERMNAGQDPITREQVAAFGRHPAGPILPDGCVAVERLPEDFGTRRDGSRLRSDEEHGRGWVHDLAVSPTGDLWLATVIGGRSAIVAHASYTGRHLVQQMSSYLLDDENGGTLFSPYIVGFKPNGTSVAFLQKVASGSGSRYWEEDVFLFIGGTRVFEGKLPKQWLTSVCVAWNGDILTVHCEHSPVEDGPITVVHSVFRNGECGVRKIGAPAIQRAFLLDDGELVTLSEKHTGHGELHHWRASEEPIRIATAEYWFDGDRHGGRIVNVRGTVGNLRITMDDGRRGVTLRHVVANGRAEAPCGIGEHHYLAHDALLPDGRGVYVGETRRDDLQCVVCGGVAGPGFDRVSNVTVHGGTPRYYGVLGTHLYTMELPETAKVQGQG